METFQKRSKPRLCTDGLVCTKVGADGGSQSGSKGATNLIGVGSSNQVKRAVDSTRGQMVSNKTSSQNFEYDAKSGEMRRSGFAGLVSCAASSGRSSAPKFHTLQP